MRSLCLILALILLCGAALTGCGADGGRKAADVDADALMQRMQEAATLPGMLAIRTGDERQERGFAAISTLSFEKVEAFSLLYAADGSAYELAVISLKDEGDVEALKNTLKAHIDSRAQTYRTYSPEQAPRAEAAVVAAHGRTVALIMCDDNAAVRAVFDQAF